LAHAENNLSGLRDPVLLFAYGFGSGLAPFAPGTFGSLLGVLLAYGLLAISAWTLWIATAVATIAGVPLCGAAARRLQQHDHPSIVWDEIVGVLLTASLWQPHAWSGWVAVLVAFRIFDISKPWPISYLDQNVKGGVGIVVDDVVAAVFAAISLGLLDWQGLI